MQKPLSHLSAQYWECWAVDESSTSTPTPTAKAQKASQKGQQKDKLVGGEEPWNANFCSLHNMAHISS